jgi:arylsulfatase A-like enzyme
MLLSSIEAQEKPNIIFILADDLGYGDLSCYGANDLHTPQIDKLAKKGIKFTRAYANSTVCSPSRESILII